MITVLVEGNCEEQVLPILVRREHRNLSLKCIDMKGKSNIVRRRDGFEETVRRQHALGGRFFIILIDGDVTYAPYESFDEELHDMPLRAQSLSQELRVAIQVCWAVRMIESWLIGGIVSRSSYCTLKPGGQAPPNTETVPQNPKRWLADRLRDEYDPQTQRCLAGKVDLQEAKVRNHSMRIFFDHIERADDSGGAKRGSRRY